MDALVLGGGVAKGAFIGGALSVLSTWGLRVRRIVGTSAGSLCAAYYAAGVLAGREAEAGRELARLWREEARFGNAFDPSLAGVARLEGLSTSDHLVEFLRAHIAPTPTAHAPVDLRLVTTSAAGDVGRIGAEPATTFEHVLRYEGTDFATAAALERLFAGVAASAAFPVAYVPARLDVGGRDAACWDGGLVNNCAVKHALDDVREHIDRVFVVVPYPALLPDVTELRGVPLLMHLTEILVMERLYRDLREAHAVNAALARLERELPNAADRRAALRALGWEQKKRIEIVEIRPRRPLRGGTFDGFVSRELRDEYVAAGVEAAQRVRASVAA